MIQRLVKTRQQAAPSPGGEGRDEGEGHFGYQLSALNFFQTSLRGIMREYPGLSGKRPIFLPLIPAYSRLFPLPTGYPDIPVGA